MQNNLSATIYYHYQTLLQISLVSKLLIKSRYQAAFVGAEQAGDTASHKAWLINYISYHITIDRCRLTYSKTHDYIRLRTSRACRSCCSVSDL